MNIVTVHSEKGSSKAAVNDVKGQFKGVEAKAIVFFASSCYPPAEIAREMQEAFPGVVTFGCSTSGEIVSGKMLKNSLVAMALNSAIVEDLDVRVIEGVKGNESGVKQAFSAFQSHYGIAMSEMDYRKYVGLILVDGLSATEERLMDQIGNSTNVTFIGGSAGDDLKFASTHVYSQGRAYTDAAVLALVKSAKGCDIIKTQSFVATDKKLVATKVLEASREVLEFNHQPAARAYAEALGTTVEKAADQFMSHPLGLMVGDEPYVRSPQQLKGDSMVFYCAMPEGMELSILNATDMIKDTKQALADKVEELGGISGIINFHCILRTLELEQKGLTEAYGKIFTDVPTVGFSTYGEELIGHINQTATMLVLK